MALDRDEEYARLMAKMKDLERQRDELLEQPRSLARDAKLDEISDWQRQILEQICQKTHVTGTNGHRTGAARYAAPSGSRAESLKRQLARVVFNTLEASPALMP